jgi:hypothetical protein
MQPAVKPFGKRIGKYLFHPFISFIPGAETISMPDKEFFTTEFELLRIVKNRNIQFLFEIIVHPKIMVPNEEIYRDSAITNFSQLSQSPHESFRHYMFILEPEIKQIPE